MSAKLEQPMISNEAKKTREQPNLTECQSCGLRTPSHKRLEILYSEWRIILLCTKCFNLVESSKICSYCFRKFSAKAKSFRCCHCKRVVHKSCFANRKNVAPWSYSCYDDSGGGFSVCVDCWVPKSVAIKRGKVCGVSKRNNTGVLGRSLEDVVEDAACTVQEKVEAAVRARELVVRMALEARKAVDVARKTLDLVANNGGGKESNDNADDFELAFRLHRAMSNSPRVSSNLCLVNSSCLGVPMIGEDNGEMRTRNSELRNLGAFEKLDGFMNQIVEVGRLKSNGNDDGIIRPDAKKDGSVGMQMKQRKQSFFNKLINSRGDDRSVSSDSQSYREGNESMVPDYKGCKRKHDRYLLKYSRKRVLFKYSRSKVMLKYCRRKIDERLIPNGRPKFLYEGLLSRVGLPQQNNC
uniref:Phorbol-ester/DAG-type domain-containing protein n=1 Tax=Salix viminalis TaxID=40686 RepID=A0A6N2LME9_SALVM